MSAAAILRRKAGSLAADERGIAIIEFAYLLPFLALLVGGIIDLSTGLADRFTMQQAVNRSLEIIQANRPQIINGQTEVDYSFLVTETATAANVTADKVTLTKWLECSGTKKTNYNDSCAAGEDTARYLELKVAKNFVGKLFVKTVPITASGAVRIQ